jgi:hypothetical protein
MFLRVFPFFLLMFFFTSCDKFSFSKSKNKQVIDTNVNFTSVDVSPSFKVCDTLIDKQQKSDCFRTTIHKKIGEELQKYSFSVQDSISEIVFVDLIINAIGAMILEEIQSSENIKSKLPALDSLLKLSIKKMPSMYPAIKRGITVATKYRLPIRIELKE